jgi:F-type H+-transporting ATPase subunit b
MLHVLDGSVAPTLLAGHPLIDIDSTVFIQFALFLVLYWFANKWLFQPYLALRQRRKDGIEGARAEAERTSASADAKLADYEKKLAAARARGNEEGRKLRAEATAHEREVTDRARTDAQRQIDEAQASLRAQTEAARGELMPQAQSIARQIASRLLGREVA